MWITILYDSYDIDFELIWANMINTNGKLLYSSVNNFICPYDHVDVNWTLVQNHPSRYISNILQLLYVVLFAAVCFFFLIF